jgi:hypothetical protein
MTTKTLDRLPAYRLAQRRSARPRLTSVASLFAALARGALIWIAGYVGVALILYLASLAAT